MPPPRGTHAPRAQKPGRATPALRLNDDLGQSRTFTRASVSPSLRYEEGEGKEMLSRESLPGPAVYKLRERLQHVSAFFGLKVLNCALCPTPGRGRNSRAGRNVEDGTRKRVVLGVPEERIRGAVQGRRRGRREGRVGRSARSGAGGSQARQVPDAVLWLHVGGGACSHPAAPSPAPLHAPRPSPCSIADVV